MPTPARRTITPSLLAAVVAAFPDVVAAQGLMDCTPPLPPAAVMDRVI